MKNVIAYVHTHWDREWYQNFEEFRLRLVEVFDDVLCALVNGNLSCFYFDGQVCALEDYLQIHNEKINLVKYFIKEKKLRIGPFYCSSDSFLVSGESLYRNLQFGIEKSKQFGETDFIAYIADSFGHSKDIPVLLKSMRISKACLWRGLGDYKADLNWNGIKVTNLIQGYFQNFLNSDLSIEQKAEQLKNYIDKISKKSGRLILLPVGADHLAAVKNLNPIIKKLNKIYEYDYKISIGSPFDYFYRIYKNEKIDGELSDNSKTFLLKGIYSSRPYIKRANAQTQWLLTRIAEPLNALCSKYLGIQNKQSEINYAYKELIKNHAHDSIYGCVIDDTAKDIMHRYKTVNTVANGIIKRAVRDLESNQGDFTVINLSNYKYSGKVFLETEKELPPELNAVKIHSRRGFTGKKLYNINDIPITEDVTEIYTYMIDVKDLEPFSLTKITPDKLCSEKHIKTGKNHIENAYIKIQVKNNKIAVTDKITGSSSNDFISIKDRADIGDSYNFGALKKDTPVKAVIKSYNIKEVNDVKAVLEVLYEIEIPLNSDENGRTKNTDKCKININFTLYNQSRMAEIEVYWVNKSKNHILQLSINLKDKITSTVSEDLYSTVKREFNADYDIYKYIPANKGIELKTNTAPMQRFVSAQNITLITKGINEYEVSKNTLSLTLLRATGIISNPLNPARGTPAGPPVETPELQCLGDNTANFAFAFTNSEEIMYELAEEFYNPCVCLFSEHKNKIFFKPKGRVQAVTTQNNSLVARVYNGELQNIIIKH